MSVFHSITYAFVNYKLKLVDIDSEISDAWGS